MRKLYTFPIEIYYEDTDAGGVVYHSNYLKFFERARTDIMRQLGISQQQMLNDERAFVVTHAELKYLKGAVLDQKLVVETRVTKLKQASVVFEQMLKDDQNDYCFGCIKVGFIDLTKKRPKPIPLYITSELDK